ncbi:hypothetical protein J8J17_22530, partial [Mycobacterium tuberculosis]|nr:hypothetical protein [Mycobacterium tuberculosis]
CVVLSSCELGGDFGDSLAVVHRVEVAFVGQPQSHLHGDFLTALTALSTPTRRHTFLSVALAGYGNHLEL